MEGFARTADSQFSGALSSSRRVQPGCMPREP